MSQTAVRISSLNPYIGSKIKGTDIIPLINLNLDGVTYSTIKATALQLKAYVAESITDQELFKNSKVQFASITGVQSISAAKISATDISMSRGAIGELSIASKYVTTIEHTGAASEQLYEIYHPFKTTDLLVQVWELFSDGATDDVNEIVLTSTVNRIDGERSVTDVFIMNVDDANYRVVVIG